MSVKTGGVGEKSEQSITREKHALVQLNREMISLKTAVISQKLEEIKLWTDLDNHENQVIQFYFVFF